MKKMILMGVAATLVITSLAGGSLAYFSAGGKKVHQKINTRNLGIEFTYGEKDNVVLDEGTDPGSVEVTAKAVPNKEYAYEIAVKSTGTESAYVRVKIQKSWVDWDAEVKDYEKNYELDPEMIELAYAEDDEDWIVQSVDDREIILYYTKPLDKGESTSFFFDGFKISEKAGNTYADKNFSLEFTTDGVQEYVAKEAILSEWGVAATFDKETITKIEE